MGTLPKFNGYFQASFRMVFGVDLASMKRHDLVCHAESNAETLGTVGSLASKESLEQSGQFVFRDSWTVVSNFKSTWVKRDLNGPLWGVLCGIL